LPSQQLPALTGARLVRALQAAGFALTTTPINGLVGTPLCWTQLSETTKGTLRSVLRDAGLSAEDLRSLLR
jgi:hypothetical protein